MPHTLRAWLGTSAQWLTCKFISILPAGIAENIIVRLIERNPQAYGRYKDGRIKELLKIIQPTFTLHKLFIDKEWSEENVRKGYSFGKGTLISGSVWKEEAKAKREAQLKRLEDSIARQRIRRSSAPVPPTDRSPVNRAEAPIEIDLDEKHDPEVIKINMDDECENLDIQTILMNSAV